MNPGGVGSPYGGNGMLAAGDRVGVKSSPHVVAECSGGLLPQNITTTTITTTTTTTTSSSTTSVREVQPNQAYLSGESSLGRSNLASHLQLNGLLLSQFGLYNRVVEVPHTSSKDVIAPHLLPSPILNVGEGKEQQQQLSPVPCGSGAAVVPPPGSSTHFTSTTSGSTHITNPTSDSSLNFTKPSPGSSSMCFTNPTSGSSHFSTTSDLSTQFTNPTNSLPNVCGKRYDQLTVVTSVHTEVTGNLSGISMCGEKERVTGSADAGPLQSPVAGVSGASSGTYPARNAVFPSPNSVKTLKGKRKISLEEMVNKLHKCVPSKNVVNCEVSQEVPVLSQKSIPSLLCITSSNAEGKSSESRQIISNICDNNNTANNNNAHESTSTASTVKDTLQIITENLEKSSDHCDNPKEVIGASVEPCGKSYASEDVPVQLKSDKNVEKSADDRTGSIKSVDCPQKVMSCATPVQEVDSDGSRLHLSGDCESKAEGSGHSSDGIESKNKDAQSEVLNTFCLKGQNSPKEVTTSVRGEPASVGNVMNRQSDASTSEKKVRNESADEKNVQVPTERCTAQSPAESGYEGRSSIEPTDSETRDSDIEVVFEKSGMSETGNEHPKPAQEISGSKFKNGDGDKGSSRFSKSGKNIEEIDLSKGDSDSNPSASFLNTDSGLVQYLEPISDDENSLLCAPCPSSGLSSVSGVQSSSNTPMFSDTPSDTSHGTLMVKISDAVAAILSDVSDDSLPCSPIASNSNSVDGFNSALQREKLSEKIDSICEKLDRDCAKDGNSKILSGPQSDCPQNSDKPAEKSCTKGEIVSTSDASISKGFIEDMKKDDSCLTSQTLPHVSIQIGNKQTSVGIAESCKPPSEQTQVHSGNKKSDVSEGKLSDSVCQPVTRTKPDDEPASEVISVALELLHNKDKEMASVCTRKSENTTSVTNESHSSETSSATLNLSSSLPAVAPELPPHLHLGNDSISSFCQMSKTATDNHSCQNLTSGSQTLSSHVGNSNTPQSEREDKAAHMLTYSTPKLIQDIPSVIMQESEPFIDNWVEPNTQVQSVLQEGESQVAGEKPSSDASSGFKVGHTPDANTDVPRSDTVKHAGTVDMIDPPNDKTRIEIPASLEVMKPDHSIYTSETEDHKTNRNFGSLTCELTDTENKVTRQGKSDDWSSNKCTMTLLKLDQSTERDTSIDSSSTLSECAMESVNRCVSDNSIIISDEISTNAAITTVEIEGPTSESCSPVKDHFMKKGEHTTPVPYDLTEISDPISGMSLRPKPGELCGDITRDERENAQVPHHENLSLLPVSDSRESSSFASCLSPVAEILTQCDISSMYTKSVEEEVTVQHCTTSDNAFLPNTSTSLDTHSTLVDHSDQHDVVNSQSLCDQLPQPSVENTRKQSFETNVSDSVNTSVDPECPGVNLNPDDQELKSESVKIEVKTPVSEAVTPTIEVKLDTSEIETLATEVNTTTTKILSAINEGDTLASEIKTPGTNVENLASEIKSLTSEVEASSTEIGTSVAEVETLTAEIDKVTAEIQTPVNITGMPNNEVDTITEDEAPPTEVHTLVTNTEMSITEAEMPANEGKASTTKGQMVDDQAIEPKSSGENELQFPHHDASESYQSQPGSEEVTSTSVENVQPTLSLDVCGQSESHQDLECSELADTGTNSNVNNMSDICHIGTNNSATVESEPLESVTFRSCGMSAHNSEVDQVSAVDVNVSASPVVAPGISDLSADTTQVCSTISVDQEPKEEDNSISSQITVAETVATPSNRGTDKLSEMEILMTDSIAQQENISGEPIQCIDNAAPGLVEHTVNKESETSGKPVFGSKQQLAGDETWENSSLEGKSTSCDAPDKEETIPVVANSLPKTKVFITSSVSPDECRNNVIDPSPVVSLEPKQDNTFSTTPDEGVHSLVKEIDTDTSDGGCMEMNPGTDSGASTQINTETNSDVSEEIRTEIISGPCEEITAKTDPQAHEEMPIITETASGTCEEINIKTDSRDCMDKITETYSEAYAGINTETTDSGTCAEINTPGIEVKECVDPLPSQVTDSMLQDPIMNVEQRNRCLTSEFSLTVADIEECTGEEAASLTSKTAQITDFETKSPKETLPSPTCVNGEDGMTSKEVIINKDSSQGSDGQNESTFQDVQEKEESEVLEKKDIGSLCPICTMRITETLDSHVINSHICSTFIHAKLTLAYKFHMMKRIKDMGDSFISENVTDYKDSIYVCRSCKFASKSIDAVRFHLNSHEGVYQVRPGKASCGCNKKKYSFEFHKWLSLIHNSNCYCYKCNYYFGCDNGFSCHVQAMHFIERKCKDCNADVAPEDMIPHLDLHKSEIESKENEQSTSSTVVTRSGEEKLKLSWNIYDNSLNYLDGKDFCLSTAKKVDDPNFDRNYLKLPLRNDVDDAVVPEEAKLDPGKDISKYLKDKKAVKLPLADNDEIQRQFSFAMQMALLKRMTKKGRRSASSGNSYSRSRKEDDLFTVLGISVQKSRNSFKKDNVDNSGTTPSRKCKAKSVFENVGEAGTPVLTRTRSGMVTTKGDPEDKPKEVRLRPTEVTSVVDGEWAKEHTYICCSCGAGYLHLADIMDHKWEMHPSVWCAHTMIQGQGVVPLSFCRQYQPPIARPHVLPLPEIPALDSPTTSTPDPTIRERTCTSCHAVFNSESSFHAHLVECGGLSLLSAMKKKSKKGFRFKRRKGQGVPNNRYDNTSQPSTPLKAKNGDRSSGLNTPLNDRSAASAVHTCGVKRRLELAVGSIDNVELKNRLKAIIIGSRGSSGRAVSSSRRFVKMKLRKKVLENRKLRKTRQSDRVKEIASKEQQQAQEKKDEKKGDAKDEKHESIETQTVPNSEEGKETTENVIGKDHPDIPVPKSLKSKSNNKDAKTKKLKKSKKKIDTLKDPGSTEAAVKDMNQTPDTKINILESKEKKTKDTSRKNALQAEKKVKGVKKMNGVIDKGKKASKKTLNTTGQVNKKAVNAIPAEVSVTSENGGSSIPVKKAVSKSHKAVQTVEVEGFKNLVTLGGKKGKAKKSKTVKMVMPKPAMDSKKQSLSTTKSATKHNASAKKGKVNSKQSTGEKGKLAKNEKIKPSTSKKVKEETKNNDSTPKSLASEGGLGELIHEKEGESDVQQDQEQLQMSKGTTQTKGRKGKDTGSLNPKDNSVELSVAPTTTTTTTKKEPEQKEEEQYISFSEESEEEESEEDYEPEVIHNFRSGRRCGGRLGLRHKRKLINTRYSFRTCYSTKEKDDGEGKGGVDSKVTTEINKRKVNYTEKDDDEGLTEEPLTAKRKRKIANYENQDDYTYVPNESSSDLEDEDDLSDKETSSNQESSTRVAGNRVKTRRLSSAERSVTEDIPVGTLRKSKSCDTSSDSKQEEQIKNTLQDTSSDIKEGEEVKPSLPVGDINVTTGTSTVANTLLSEVKADNEVKISTAIVMKSTEDISNSNSMEQIKTKQDAKKARPAKGKTKINPQTERTVDDQDITPLQKKARVMTLLGRLALNSVFQAQVDEVTGKLQRKRRSVRNPEDLISETEDEMENIAAENTSDPSNAPGVTMEEVKVTEAIESSVEQLGVEEKHAVESVETTHGSCSDNEEPKGEKTSTQNKMPCNEIQDVPIQNIDESVDSYSKDVLQRDELALEVCSKEETQTKQKLKPGKNEAHTKYESEAGVSEKSIDATDMKQEILFSKKRNRGRKKVAVIEGKNNTVDDAVKKMIKADEEDDDDDNLPLSILACKNKRKESPPMSTETPELHSKKKPPPKKQRLSVDDVKTEGEESVDVEDIPSLPPTPTEKYKTPAKNHKMWGSKKSKMTINVDSYASDIEVEALKDSSAEVVSSKVIEGTTKTASKCDIDQEIALGDESTSSDRQVDKTQTKSPKKKKKTKVKPKQPNQQIDVKSNENTNKSQVIPTIESPDMMRPDDEATLSSCGSPVADALSSPNATPVKGQRRRSLIEKLKEIPLQLSNQVQTMDSHDPSQLQSVHTSDEKQTTVAASKKKTAKPSRPRKRKTNELPNSKVKNKNGETLPVSPMEKNSGNLINAEDSFKTPGAFETRKNLPGKRKRAMSTSRATPEGKLASPSKDCITESVVDKDIQTSKNPSESTKKRRSGNNSKEVDLHDVNELTCLDCGLGFGSVASLEDHQQDCVTIAFEMSLMQAEDHLYECPHCQVTFALKGTQRKHTTSCRMGKYKKAQNRHDGKNGKKSYKNQPTLPTHMTQPGNKSPAAPDTPSRRSMVKGRSCSKENVAGEGDVTHTSPLRDNFVQVLLSHNDKEMGVNDGRLPENIKNLDYIPKVMSVNASSTPKLKRESQVNGRPVNGELKELLSPVNVDDNRWCSVCGCEVVDKDLYNKHRLIEQFSFCCQQPVVLEVCALITQYNLGTDTIRSLVTSAVVYQDSLALSFDATLNLSSSVSSAGNNSSNGNVAKVKEVITSPHCTWIFSTLETIVKRHQTSGTVSIRGTQQEVLRAVTLLEDILKELSESDSAIEKNKMLKSMRETFEAGTRN